MLNIVDCIKKIKPAKALVIGDFMLDMYTIGSVQRISPEAPVPILHVHEESRRPGGAGNAVLNLVSLGMEVVAVGRVGNDNAGKDLLDTIAESHVFIDGIVVEKGFQTPLKSRMIADSQQLLRVDYESPTPLPLSLEKEIIEQLPKLLQGVDVIAVSDYAKGFLTRSLLLEVISLGKKEGIPVIVDPKGMDFSKYKGATVIKPNFKEAVAAASLGGEATLDAIGAKILEDCDIEALMVTRSKEGISIFHKDQGRSDFPVMVHEVRDVTGAGDTVLAVITTALANRLDLKEGAVLANAAAGIAIERFGCARVSLHELADRLQQQVRA